MKAVTIAMLATLLNLSAVLSQNGDLTAVIDSTLQIMKANAVNRKSVDWIQLRKKALAEAKNAQNGYQLGNTFRLILKETMDFHGSVFIGDSTFRWVREERLISDSIKNEWNKGVTLQSKMLSGNIG